ncbi:MAG: family 16 glycosylhydrolase [Capsulimonas sp.]|uniref:family 16 glycosylhydrolase n=1 Tax=Capsulimonas sp. TaxID=2494211 RepID=UPI0032652103
MSIRIYGSQSQMARWRAPVILIASVAILSGGVRSACAYTDIPTSSANWSQNWADEFSGPALDSNKWYANNAKEGADHYALATNKTANGSIQSSGGVSYYQMQARKQSATDAETGAAFDYTSAAANTLLSGQPFGFLYGEVVCRAMVPTPSSGQGSWPAIWLLRTDLVYSDEIDVMENLGGTALYYTLHYGWNNIQDESGPITPPVDPRGRWLQYIMQWYPDHLSFYIDEEDGRGPVLQYQTKTGSQGGIPNHPMFLKLDEQIGGWSGDPGAITNWPLNFKVDYIRVYQTAPGGVLSPPANVTATGGGGKVTLSWNASPGATTYNVYRGASAGGVSPVVYASGISSTSYTDTNVTAGSPYYYYVGAQNSYPGTQYSSVYSHWGNEASATPDLPAPANVTAVGGSGKVTLSWTAVPGAATYNIYRGLSANGVSSNAYASGVSGTTYIDMGVTNGTPYYYYVGAQNGGVYSHWGNEATATPSSQ